MFRKANQNDKEFLFEMFDEFYASDAVLHPIDRSYYQNTFDELIRSDRYLEVYIIETDGQRVGYAMLSKSYSPEAGGKIIWIEEIYIKKEYRSLGLGSEFIAFLENKYKNSVKRLRLEAEPGNDRAIKLYLSLGFKPLNYEQYIKNF